ncbi:iron complex outermembrane receptor protein [Novosphingobium sp. PhB165]|uniref:TonB-dependent receptor n=1 Tax=Novosphingobium sp. PhB165 TaxID=2485105 RepID=UPI0010E17295|nr:TonB-dependent receptor [Novosphingobium sp. PhB165]TCM14608.1 iron complex outermembrane receptor protein [Novosphingobium sp. PhB165]
MAGLYTARSASVLMMACVTASWPAMAFAQQSTGDKAAPAPTSTEIVVTAQRRAEASRDVPISVTSLGPEQLATANVEKLSDTARITPGLRFDTQGPAVQPTIRGVGTAITTSGGGPNVGIYVDGFFQANTYMSDFDLLNVRSIQVLKGPQGTLFGRNTTGGAIIITTDDPSTETSGEAKISYSRFNAVNAQAYATFGISDRVAMDVEGLYRRSDGYFTDVSNGNDKIGKSEDWSIRVGMKADLTDDVSLLLRWIHAETDDPTTQLVNAYVDQSGGAGFFDKVSAAGQAIYGMSSSKGLPLVYLYAPTSTFATKPSDVLLNTPVSFRSNSDALQVTLKADMGFADFTSYTQYRKDLSPYYGDLDATAIPMFNIYVGVNDETWSQEFLLNSKPGSPLQWTAGLNYFQIRDTWDIGASFGGLPYAPFGGSSTTTKSYAAFLDATYQVSDKLFLTLGGRYSHDIVGDAYFITNFTTTSFTGPNGESIPWTGGAGVHIPVSTLKNDSFTPRAVIRFKPSEESSVYASYTKGYKAGILNVGGYSQQPVKPEKINAFEVGYKYDDRVFSADLAGFYYDYKNLQVSSYQNGTAQIRNAASSEIYGLEAQLRYKVSSAFSVQAGASWTHARYKSFTDAPYYSYCDPAVTDLANSMACIPKDIGGTGPGALTQTSTDASGFKMQRAPEFTGNIGASYGLDLGGGRLALSGNLYYTSSFYFDPSEQFKQKGYEVLALRAEWTDPSDRYTVAVFGDNVTNRRYSTQVLFNTLGTGAVWNSPVTYGIELGAKFR